MKKFFFQTEQMSVGYNGKPLIKQIEISLHKGEILTLIGPNGAGKSTILKTITKQLTPIKGMIFIERDEINLMTEKELAKKMALVLTERIRPELMTCREVVETGRYPYTGRLGILSEHDHKKSEEAMKLVDIEELKEKEFLTLSDGQKQRVLLARAICQEPDILVMDEPTSYLDMKYKLEFLAILQRMTREQGLTVIMSLHELDLAERVSHQILCVKGERIAGVGTPEDIFKPGYISKLYDMEEGTYDEISGRPELPAVKGTPQVFVIAGGGSGAAVYRRLQRFGIPFSTGILSENDRDYPVAKVLAVKVIAEKAFFNIAERTFQRAKEEMKRCKRVICCVESFGEQNESNRQLLEHAKAEGNLRDASVFISV